MSRRPELIAPPEFFYNDEEAEKYSQNTRIKEIQKKMSIRALEILCLPKKPKTEEEKIEYLKTHKKPFTPSIVLDIGCGSCISGEVLEDYGHHWVGIDISKDMLNVGNNKISKNTLKNGDLFQLDMGNGLPFRIGVFDQVISISALQWLCNADKKSHVPQKRIHKFFTTCYSCLKKGGKAVFQFYPQNSQQLNMLSKSALKCGFSGGVVVDYPHSTIAKKYFLVLFAGVDQDSIEVPDGLDSSTGNQNNNNNNNTVTFIDNTKKQRYKPKKRVSIKSREWILRKKAVQRLRGMVVRKDTKYTGRKRHK